MKVIYGRISTPEQNEERQTQAKDFDKQFIDVCSGAISFFDRTQAKKLIQFLKENPEAETQILSVDRLGRSTIDILTTIQYFKKHNYRLKIENIGLDNSSPFFDLMISIIGTLAEHERQVIKERCSQGIKIAKQKGIYKGRKSGTIDDRTKILSKHQDIVNCLNSKMKVSKIAETTNKTRATVYKVKSVL